jgi:tetratricopeptide (TPR) repeat protein
LILLRRFQRLWQGASGIFVILAMAGCSTPPQNNDRVNSSQMTPSDNKPKVNRGWEGLAQLLDKITPDIDTSIPPSGEQIDLQIEALINAGDVNEALIMIQERQAVLARSTAPGNDVQLMFQHARALARLGETQEAKAIYIELTERFPELIQPWNNLAVLYAKEGDISKAEQALQTALLGNPNNANAKFNLAKLQQAMTDSTQSKTTTTMPITNPADSKTQ